MNTTVTTSRLSVLLLQHDDLFPAEETTCASCSVTAPQWGSEERCTLSTVSGQWGRPQSDMWQQRRRELSALISTETTTEASHSSVCLSCEKLQTPPETFTDHCHANRVTCWQHSETHSWRNNCKLLQNESCCTWRCLWYKCLQMLLSSCSCVSSQNIVSIIFTLVSSTQGPEEWAHSSTNRQRAGGKL